MIIRDLVDVLTVDQVAIKRAQIRRHFQLRSGDDLAGGFIDRRVNVERQSALKHAAERLENSAFEIEIIFFVENLQQSRDTHHQPDQSIGVTREVTGQPIILPKPGDQNRSPERAENVNAGEKIRVIELALVNQVLQRHFHQHNQVLL